MLQAELFREVMKSLVHALLGHNGARSDEDSVPPPRGADLEVVHPLEGFLNLQSRHGTWEVLLIGKNHDDGVPGHVLQQDILDQLVQCLVQPLRVMAVHDVHVAVRVGVVVAIQGSYLVSAAQVPAHNGGAIGGFDGLHVKPNGGDGLHDFPKLEAVEQRRLARCVQACLGRRPEDRSEILYM